MSYIDQHLLPDETLLARAKVHWGAFATPAILLTLGFLVTVAFTASDDLLALSCFGWALGLLGIYGFLRTGVGYLTTEFGLTNLRIIAKTGALRQESIEVLLDKVESLSVSQPIMGRMIGYGTIIVVGSGGTKQKFKNIAKPMLLRSRVNEQIAASRQ